MGRPLRTRRRTGSRSRFSIRWYDTTRRRARRRGPGGSTDPSVATFGSDPRRAATASSRSRRSRCWRQARPAASAAHAVPRPRITAARQRSRVAVVTVDPGPADRLRVTVDRGLAANRRAWVTLDPADRRPAQFSPTVVRTLASATAGGRAPPPSPLAVAATSGCPRRARRRGSHFAPRSPSCSTTCTRSVIRGPRRVGVPRRSSDG